MPLQRALIMTAATVYEPLVRFQEIIGISPFTFKDFCVAVSSGETNNLLRSIFIQLLSLLMRDKYSKLSVKKAQEEDPLDVAFSHFIDEMTWPEVVRRILCQQNKDEEEEPPKLNENFFGNGPSFIINNIKQLIDIALCTTEIRKKVDDCAVHNEKRCRSCGRQNEISSCSYCPASFCKMCLSKEDESNVFNTMTRTCCICSQFPTHVNCLEPESFQRLLPIGFDSCGRKYWFAANLLIVE
jgi:hypothetical protein